MTLVNYYQVLFYVQQTHKEWKAATLTAQKILQLPGIENYPFLQYDVYNNLHLVYKELSVLSTGLPHAGIGQGTQRFVCSCKKKVASWKSFP